MLPPKIVVKINIGNYIYTYVDDVDTSISPLKELELERLAKLSAEIWNTQILCNSNIRVEAFTQDLLKANGTNNVMIYPPFSITFQLGEYLSSAQSGNYTSPWLKHVNRLLDTRDMFTRKCLYNFVKSKKSYTYTPIYGHSVERGYIHLSTYKFNELDVHGMLLVLMHEMGRAIGYVDSNKKDYVMGAFVKGSQMHTLNNATRYFDSLERKWLRQAHSRIESGEILSGGWISYSCEDAHKNNDLNSTLTSIQRSGAYDLRNTHTLNWDTTLQNLRITDRLNHYRQLTNLENGYLISSEQQLRVELNRMKHLNVRNFFEKTIVIPSFDKNSLRYIIRLWDGLCWSVTDKTNEMWRLAMALNTTQHVPVTVSVDDRSTYQFKDLLHGPLIGIDGKPLNLNIYFNKTRMYAKYSDMYKYPDNMPLRNNPYPEIPFDEISFNATNFGENYCNDKLISYRFYFMGKVNIVTEDDYVHSDCGGTNQGGMKMELFIIKHICDKSIHAVIQQDEKVVETAIRKASHVVDNGQSIVKSNEKEVVEYDEYMDEKSNRPPDLEQEEVYAKNKEEEDDDEEDDDEDDFDFDFNVGDYSIMSIVGIGFGVCVTTLTVICKYCVCNKKSDHTARLLEARRKRGLA
uniref:Putative secreted protein n=1 Tax=Ixodes ricinus TaxID=34613 RepID=A0A0K8R9K7_IXORI